MGDLRAESDAGQRIERFLIATTERHLAGAAPNLAEAIRYSLFAPGKRIRPRLALATGRMLELAEQPALCAGAAIEMIHCFTLIHDDLPCLDNDDFRRGRPSNHKVHGEGLALLAGDALIGLANDALLDAEVAADRLRAAFRTYSEAIGPRGVIGGQAAEMLLTADSSLEELSRMHALKTGALFRASLLLPAELAGIASGSSEYAAIARFADDLGLAFQVVDDLEDAGQDARAPLAERARQAGSDSPFTSILHYLAPETARIRTLARLDASIGGLRSTFGPSPAAELLVIAQEVRKHLA